MNTIIIEGQLRSEIGKKATRRLRSEAKTPGVIYGGPKEVNFSAPELAFKDLVYTSRFQTAEIKIGEKIYTCVLKAVQFHPVTDELIHVDFLELVEDKKIVVSIPLKFVGESEGVKAGGKLLKKLKSLKVKTLPKNLQESIDVNIDKLKMNENIRVEEVRVDGFEILNAPRIPICTVVSTRQLLQTAEELEAPEVEEEEATEEKTEA